MLANNQFINFTTKFANKNLNNKMFYECNADIAMNKTNVEF